jgi:hypothetical protein
MQYCPDESRAEAANIGVVLFCPELRYLQARTAEGSDRVRRFFGSRSVDAHRLNDAKRALVNRLGIESEGFRTLDDFTRFGESRANGVLLTRPRPVRVVDPAAEIEDLFRSLVGGRDVAAQPSQLVRRLRTALDLPALQGRILRDQEVLVPVVETPLRAPCAFRNGRLNLICPLYMTARALAQAREYALQGDLLHRHEGEMATPTALWVAIARAGGAGGDKDRGTAEALFRDYGLPFYHEERLDALAPDVQAALHS